jgi:hypothetical protein
MKDIDKKHLAEVQINFTRGYKLGKLITNDFKILQKQFALKSLDKDSQNFHKYRAISLGFDSALLDRGLLKKEQSKLNLTDTIKNALKKFKDIDKKSRDRSDDLSHSR